MTVSGLGFIGTGRNGDQWILGSHPGYLWKIGALS